MKAIYESNLYSGPTTVLTNSGNYMRNSFYQITPYRKDGINSSKISASFCLIVELKYLDSTQRIIQAIHHIFFTPSPSHIPTHQKRKKVFLMFFNSVSYQNCHGIKKINSSWKT